MPAECEVRQGVLELRPEPQPLAVGDRVVLHGPSRVGTRVAIVEPERALVLGGEPNAA